MNSSVLEVPAVEKAPEIPKFLMVLSRDSRTVTTRSGRKFESPKPVYTAYAINPDILSALAKLADKDCYKCQSTGIKDWRAKGMKARICACVLAKQERAKEFLAAQKGETNAEA